ncbi:MULTISPECIES: NADH-quinone oxidoreductase subunit C [unclassified Beijerinckia]|uniref:NADH-quinone oxidoreductase subunit C n=1 Tax=unclassified Beijerinckia TaxID=2638183 RepID=UPI000897238E|nr:MULTISPECIES: NADH-quinone oxidoreductase subunit C [unclassified Beijerinckia]MDH7796049.1 NADH-quinone oxidoreductase subunit C [Beijerinckia sp. GAS462]SEC27986.1 NADH dehydrogenase subunit C [Beijerinckia sp. 28-YEA-48]
MDDGLKSLGDSIAAALPGAIERVSVDFGELNVIANPARILDVLKHLYEAPDCLFVNLVDITAVDYPQREKRFDVVYHALSPRHNRRIRVKAFIGEDETIASAIPVWPSANWFEREAYDMFGILFADHPDLRRLLTDYGFDGHPLRKDFPMTGYVEVRYDDAQKRVVNEPVKLTQEFRQFDFLSPWEGQPDYVLPGDEKAKG